MQQQLVLSSIPVGGRTLRPRTGNGSSTAHHGEILQGVFEAEDGHLRRGLVSLGSPLFRSDATFLPCRSSAVTVDPAWKIKARRAVEMTLAHVDVADWGGRVTIHSNVPLRWGLGSSTCDVTAAIRAAATALGTKLTPEVIAGLAVEAEIASDSTMFGDRAILFAQRSGIVTEDLGGRLPSLEVLGFNTDPTGAGIDTLAFAPARYTWWEIEAFRPLLGLMRQAVQTRDSRLCGRVASASARLNQRHLPKPHFDRLDRLGECAGAVGLQVAHSGTVAGLLFDPNDRTVDERIQYAREHLAELGFGSIWRFRVADAEGSHARTSN